VVIFSKCSGDKCAYRMVIFKSLCPSVFCKVSISPPFIIKWVANECLRMWVSCPLGVSISKSLITRLKVEYPFLNGAYFLISSANDSIIGSYLIFPFFVSVKIILLSTIFFGVIFAASLHLVPTLKQILTVM